MSNYLSGRFREAIKEPTLDRRNFIVAGFGTGASCILPGQVKAMVGVFKAPKDDYASADRIIAALPQHSYVDVMSAIMNLNDVSLTHEPHERFNQRWAYYGNPLIVRFWEQIGYPTRSDDCVAWCAASLSWALKRDGRPMPKSPESSQSFLDYGQKVEEPSLGDLCVFTDIENTSLGHIGIFSRFETSDHKTVRILGGNQGSVGGTNCPAGQGQSLVTEKVVPLYPTSHWQKTFGGFRRPPPRKA